MVRAFGFLVFLVSIFLSSLSAQAQRPVRMCLPPNSLYIPVGHPLSSDMTEAEFKSTLAEIKKAHEGFFPALNGRLRIKSDWYDGTVNAFADKDWDVFIIEVYGGLARYPTLSRDGFALIVCHEMGHHLGGAPTGLDMGWPSIEGQSDYFATLKCLRRIFEDDDNEAALRGQTIEPEVRTKCERNFSSKNDQLICMRSALASLSAARMLFELDGRGKLPDYNTPDSRQVPETSSDHPEPQCRLDSYVAGAICKAEHTENPGITDHALNTCIEGRETEGARPRCWYRPQTAVMTTSR